MALLTDSVSFLRKQESITLKLFKSRGYLALCWIPAFAGMT
ncbi:hypothetical protein RFEPED_0666 [Rickettsia felis str. Pedreira]|uniref:Uncharacterized protein n=1 Tax=Rickettsia felis str. Pedreira TaxID=1359196 RepID=A0A0F3MS62_RICFI|nr:hypothetical protein RFEPED_0666 [Rickettsia felis str. Pedreira]